MSVLGQVSHTLVLGLYKSHGVGSERLPNFPRATKLAKWQNQYLNADLTCVLDHLVYAAP